LPGAADRAAVFAAVAFFAVTFFVGALAGGVAAFFDAALVAGVATFDDPERPAEGTWLVAAWDRAARFAADGVTAVVLAAFVVVRAVVVRRAMAAGAVFLAVPDGPSFASPGFASPWLAASAPGFSAPDFSAPDFSAPDFWVSVFEGPAGVSNDRTSGGGGPVIGALTAFFAIGLGVCGARLGGSVIGARVAACHTLAKSEPPDHCAPGGGADTVCAGSLLPGSSTFRPSTFVSSTVGSPVVAACGGGAGEDCAGRAGRRSYESRCGPRPRRPTPVTSPTARSMDATPEATSPAPLAIRSTKSGDGSRTKSIARHTGQEQHASEPVAKW
jgi:hypothetical protein